MDPTDSPNHRQILIFFQSPSNQDDARWYRKLSTTGSQPAVPRKIAAILGLSQLLAIFLRRVRFLILSEFAHTHLHTLTTLPAIFWKTDSCSHAPRRSSWVSHISEPNPHYIADRPGNRKFAISQPNPKHMADQFGNHNFTTVFHMEFYPADECFQALLTHCTLGSVG